MENTNPKAKVIPFKGKIGAISGDKDEALHKINIYGIMLIDPYDKNKKDI